MSERSGVEQLRFGLIVPTLMDTEPCGMTRLAEAAVIGDEYPFETLWVGDHLQIGRASCRERV